MIAKPFMFDTVGKLFQSPIFSACQIFELGPQSKLLAAENVVPESTKIRWWNVKELITKRKPCVHVCTYHDE